MCTFFIECNMHNIHRQILIICQTPVIIQREKLYNMLEIVFEHKTR